MLTISLLDSQDQQQTEEADGRSQLPTSSTASTSICLKARTPSWQRKQEMNRTRWTFLKIRNIRISRSWKSRLNLDHLTNRQHKQRRRRYRLSRGTYRTKSRSERSAATKMNWNSPRPLPASIWRTEEQERREHQQGISFNRSWSQAQLTREPTLISIGQFLANMVQRAIHQRQR